MYFCCLRFVNFANKLTSAGHNLSELEPGQSVVKLLKLLLKCKRLMYQCDVSQIAKPSASEHASLMCTSKDSGTNQWQSAEVYLILVRESEQFVSTAKLHLGRQEYFKFSPPTTPHPLIAETCRLINLLPPKSGDAHLSNYTRPINLCVRANMLTCAISLKDVELKVPAAVSPGDTVTLICNYDLEGEELYTVKWYKGREEFYRYIPKELPNTRVFPLPNVEVDMSRSGKDRVVLRKVGPDLAGKYRCEVSADAPNFHTEVVSAHMQVIQKLEGEPELSVEKERYAVGDTLRANCTSPAHNPPANMSITLNGQKVRPTLERRWAESDGRWVTVIGFESKVTRAGKVRLACVADLFGVFRAQSELTLDEDRPRLASLEQVAAALVAVPKISSPVSCGAVLPAPCICSSYPDSIMR
ncbi:hypothetical protein LSTR_LSTR010195 [Laodelphax striatellus]|uniref:Ig-like domain-containing protein n=1 Tax=Laodelphax striatellus TaxID=195883 RepID=A0A482WPN3_LAOST|nr:hypothetical protein LSTR_LSTR010195 [Laodelphax striatellus]